MEVIHKDLRKAEYSLDELKAFDVVTILEETSKLNGHKGFSVKHLLPGDDDCSGIFRAMDGLASQPIDRAELVQGLIIHSEPGGGPLQRGGPLRIWFPSGVAVQPTPCGTGNKPVEMKFVTTLILQ